MALFDTLQTNILSMNIQNKHYDTLCNLLYQDDAVFRMLTDAATEQDILDFLSFFQSDDVDPWDNFIEGNQAYIYTGFLVPAYEKGWYTLCSWIYCAGYYDWICDPLCGKLPPLAYAALQHNPEFAQAYIEAQKRSNLLVFDDVFDRDGRWITLLEAIVLSDDVDVMKLCLDNGACPNAFCLLGDSLLDLTRGEGPMRDLLLRYGARSASDRERNLIRLTNELRYDCLQQETMDAFLAQEPLLTLSWRNGTTPRSAAQLEDVVLEAALFCCSALLEQLYPLIANTLDDDRRKHILLAILDQYNTFPSGRAEEHPESMALSLEALLRSGFRYPADPGADVSDDVLDMIASACWTFDLLNIPTDIQTRVFFALWQIGNAPASEEFIRLVQTLEKEHFIMSDRSYHELEPFLAQVRLKAAEA